jgi:hypothetical protein
MMGLRPSPYFTGQGTYYAEELVVGNHEDPSNPLHWATVRLNLPGSDTYTPSLPWVTRLKWGGTPANAFKRYVDDLRTLGLSNEECWLVGHLLATGFAYLGLQVALRKLRVPDQHPGPWAGTIAFSCSQGVGVTCPLDKWQKAKRLLGELKTELEQNDMLQRKPLESLRGFFIHLMRTFPIITPH